MRFIGEEGVTVRALEELARTPTNLNGMETWGYVLVEPDPADTRPKPAPLRLGDSRHTRRPEGSGDMAAAIRHYRETLEGALR